MTILGRLGAFGLTFAFRATSDKLRESVRFACTVDQKHAPVFRTDNPTRRATVSGPGRACFMIAILGYFLAGNCKLCLAASTIAINTIGFAPRFCFGFDICGGQAVLEHQVADLVDCNLCFPCNQDVSLRLELLKLCLDLL
ncbi:hypothetical protein J2793_004530 [Paraburkholderia caledonica]|uniref:Uncharacterized protein n=1 Tax=Paraburkholderia caledonica TaxID=134536 RepID=A0AB73IIV1_9BURK|nr:hypothetical protein [Paraburkholderia caledonica]